MTTEGELPPAGASGGGSTVAELLERYIEVVTALAPHYPPAARAPVPAPGCGEEDLERLAAALGRPVPRQVADLFRAANGVEAFQMFSVNLRSVETIAENLERDTEWLSAEIDLVLDDTEDERLRSSFEGRRVVLAGGSDDRSDLVFFLLGPDPDAEWRVAELVNGRWWEVPENCSPDVESWLSTLIDARERASAWQNVGGPPSPTRPTRRS